ncbi:MAG: hypothetical protein KIT62_07395 [Cyclobacteriaceae bacterium]|nr:hypothetical protein [Cyclobacteriaceae bacterium]
MSWTTLYISGRPGFKEAVMHKLHHTSRSYLPGAADSENDLLLYWIDNSIPLRDFKNEIGSKLIFRYRLRFHYSVPTETKDSTRLTLQEAALVKKMNTWEAEHYRHSA